MKVVFFPPHPTPRTAFGTCYGLTSFTVISTGRITIASEPDKKIVFDGSVGITN